jgi:hypothetical protein
MYQLVGEQQPENREIAVASFPGNRPHRDRDCRLKRFFSLPERWEFEALGTFFSKFLATLSCFFPRNQLNRDRDRPEKKGNTTGSQ